MKAFSIVKYSNIIKSKIPSRVLLQLILPETKEIYYNSLLQQKENERNIQIICLEEIKLQLLGKSCQCQGINTIIAMLITSKKPDVQMKDMYKFDAWMKEYLLGLENEIYCIKIKCELLFNLNFNDLVKIIYELTKFIVIGTDVIHQELKPFVCLNPYNYRFSPFDHLIYLIASRQPNEEEINDKDAEIGNNKDYKKSIKVISNILIIASIICIVIYLMIKLVLGFSFFNSYRVFIDVISNTFNKELLIRSVIWFVLGLGLKLINYYIIKYN